MTAQLTDPMIGKMRAWLADQDEAAAFRKAVDDLPEDLLIAVVGAYHRGGIEGFVQFELQKPELLRQQAAFNLAHSD